jgi:predicted Fe-Mo cluster-binding NifX family protein
MSYKIAVASSDGKVVNQHFGKADQFLIFDADDEGYRFLELRKSTPPCNAFEHDENALEQAAYRLSDCRVLLAARIGPGAQVALEARGIASFAVTELIDTALNKIILYYKKINSKQK